MAVSKKILQSIKETIIKSVIIKTRTGSFFLKIMRILTIIKLNNTSVNKKFFKFAKRSTKIFKVAKIVLITQ